VTGRARACLLSAALALLLGACSFGANMHFGDTTLGLNDGLAALGSHALLRVD
jgi:hypothetical protein